MRNAGINMRYVAFVVAALLVPALIWAQPVSVPTPRLSEADAGLSDPVQLALIVLASSIIAGIISITTLWFNNRSLREAKKEEVEAAKQERIRIEAREDARAQRVSEAAEAARHEAALARSEIKTVSHQIDGLLAQKKEADIREGQRLEKIVGEEKAATLAQGQQEGRTIERERAKADGPLAALGDSPVPVVDDVAGDAAVKSAAALESLAKSAKKTEDK